MFKVEVVEVAGIVEVVKTTVTKKSIMRRDYRAKKIGVEEDAVEEEAADQIFSATNVRNMATMQIIVTTTNVTIVAEWVIMQQIVESRKKWKKPST